MASGSKVGVALLRAHRNVRNHLEAPLAHDGALRAMNGSFLVRQRPAAERTSVVTLIVDVAVLSLSYTSKRPLCCTFPSAEEAAPRLLRGLSFESEPPASALMSSMLKFQLLTPRTYLQCSSAASRMEQPLQRKAQRRTLFAT